RQHRGLMIGLIEIRLDETQGGGFGGVRHDATEDRVHDAVDVEPAESPIPTGSVAYERIRTRQKSGLQKATKVTEETKAGICPRNTRNNTEENPHTIPCPSVCSVGKSLPSFPPLPSVK